VGIQINLLFEVWLIVFSNIMVHEGDRNDQRDMLLPIVINDFQQLLFFIGGELFSQIAHRMHEDVCIFLKRDLQLKGFHEKGLVLLIKLCQWKIYGIGD
jgi:hypothetical protein